MPNLTGSLKTFITWVEVQWGVLLFLIKTHGDFNDCKSLFFKLNLGSRHVPEMGDQVNDINTFLVEYFG